MYFGTFGIFGKIEQHKTISLTDNPYFAPSTYVCFFVVVWTSREKLKDVTEKTNIRQFLRLTITYLKRF